MAIVDLSSAQMLASIGEQLGRPLRVLHLGNVANYAYVNAKIMRARGVEAHVFDPDFYHIMATPEWQDATFTARFSDQFKPIWRLVDLHGYQRPDWFVQGPFLSGLRALGQLQSNSSRLKRWATQFELGLSKKRALDDFSGPIARFLLASGHPFARIARLPLTLVQKLAIWLSKPTIDPELTLPGVPAEWQLDDSTRRMVASVFSYYDIVQGYTLSAQLAAQAGHPRYIACELGTLRGLPFEESPTGRLTAWLYLNAPEVMITNPDCIPAARRLGIHEDRMTPILHPYDIEAALQVIGNEMTPPPRDGPVMFFAPARHHWTQGNASWVKGNDTYIRALGQLAKEGHDFELVTVDWGQETAQSRDLIEELGLTDRTRWIDPAPRQELWQWYRKSSAVLDQFSAESFGGAGLDAMISGRRLITRFDAQATAPFFRHPPPLRSAITVEDVVVAARNVILDPTDEAREGAALFNWVREYHGTERQLSDQFEVYQRLLR